MQDWAREKDILTKNTPILRNAGSLSSETIVVATVHDVQIVEEIPRDEWDVPVDVIVTPSKVLRTRKAAQKDSYT